MPVASIWDFGSEVVWVWVVEGLVVGCRGAGTQGLRVGFDGQEESGGVQDWCAVIGGHYRIRQEVLYCTTSRLSV